jgi:hypothetical protein
MTMAEQFSSERQKRVEQLMEQGHSRTVSVGTAWAEQDPDFQAAAGVRC